MGTVIRVSTFSLKAAAPSSAMRLRQVALEAERLGDHADRKRPKILGDLGDHWGGAGAGAAPHAGRDEDHIGPLEGVAQLLVGFLGRPLADRGGAAPAPSPRW